MGFAQTVLDFSFAAMALMFGVISAVFFGFAICMWIGFLYQKYCDQYDKSKTTNMEMRRYGNGYGFVNRESEYNNSKLIHLLLNKISSISKSDHNPQAEEERKRFSGLNSLECKICLKKFSDTEKTSPWVVVMPDCCHVCHRECSHERFTSISDINVCPCCHHRVRLEDLKEVLIEIKPYD